SATIASRSAPSSSTTRTRCRSGATRTCVADATRSPSRKRHDDRRAVAGHALDGHPAAVGLDDRPADVESEAEPRPVFVLELREPLEDLALLLGRDPGPLVADRDPEVGRGVGCGDDD